jgi:signal transduction histidine kinase
VQYETRFAFPGLGLRQVDVSFLPAYGDAGEVLGVVVRVQDIEQRKQREDDLNQALASLKHKTLDQERFIHIISHDLREPINNLNLVRLDQSAVAWQPVDLNLLADQVRDDLAMALQGSNSQLLIGELPTVSGDPSLLRIALQNLAGNALKFSRPGITSVVSLSAQNIGSTWRIEVSDNGIGIPTNQLDAVFGIFKRLHSRKQYDGTGLGLSICRRIAELHQGSISATSELGVGSCFTLVLPQPAA